MNSIKQIKSFARFLRKQSPGLARHVSLDLAAAHYGYRDYFHARRDLSLKVVLTKTTLRADLENGVKSSDQERKGEIPLRETSRFPFPYEKDFSAISGHPKDHWFLGTNQVTKSPILKPMGSQPTVAFIGMTGSGKTEAMKALVLAAKLADPNHTMIVLDPKDGGDWDSLAGLTESRRILSRKNEFAEAVAYVHSELIERKLLTENSGPQSLEVPSPLTLVIDDLPNFAVMIGLADGYKDTRTTAGRFWYIMTAGRPYGVQVVTGSQFADARTQWILKLMRTRVCFHVGSRGESEFAIGSDAAFLIGRGSDADSLSGRVLAFVDHDGVQTKFPLFEEAATKELVDAIAR